ncbi:MAG: hypothetical protein WD048_08355 [Chitinophagales bacterium]
MKSAIITSDSKKDLELLIEIAHKFGIKAKILSDEQMEDLGMVKAIKTGRTGEFIDTDKFLNSLK